MVRPEPDQTLGKADFGVERRIQPRAQLLEKHLPLWRDARRCSRRHLGRDLRLGGIGWRAVHGLGLLLNGLAGALGDDVLRPPLGPSLKGGARRGRAGQEPAIINPANAWTFQFGEKRPTRISRYGGDRAGPRPEAKSV